MGGERWRVCEGLATVILLQELGGRCLRLQCTLGAYRSVMEQPRQGDLIKLMRHDVDWPRIDLRPPRRK